MKKNIFKYAILTLLLVIVSSSAFAQANTKVYNDKKKSEITYTMTHPFHEWTGVSSDVTSVIVVDANKDNISQVAVTAKLASFDSKNANRDSHMIEVTDGIKYPSVTFASKSIEKSGNTLKVKGNLTFHGITKSISFDAQVKKSGDQLTVTGGFPVKMTDYKIDPPSLLGIVTKDEFKIDFKVVF
jgi:polyisoprenoid-binding protein YceI